MKYDAALNTRAFSLEHVLIFKIYCTTLIFPNVHDMETPSFIPSITTRQDLIETQLCAVLAC